MKTLIAVCLLLVAGMAWGGERVAADEPLTEIDGSFWETCDLPFLIYVLGNSDNTSAILADNVVRVFLTPGKHTAGDICRMMKAAIRQATSVRPIDSCDSEFRGLLSAAEDVQSPMHASFETYAMTLEYRTPANELRKRADDMERQDAAIRRFREAIRKARECVGREVR